MYSSIVTLLIFCEHLLFHIFCVHFLYFSTYKYTLGFFLFCFVFFCTSLISFCNFFTFLLVLFFNFFILLKISYPHQNPSLKFDPLICVHRHAVSPVHFLHHVLRSLVFLFFFSLCLFDVQLLFLNTYQKMINGVGWLDDRHGLSPILYDTAPLFVYTNQLLCHCVFICSNVR